MAEKTLDLAGFEKLAALPVLTVLAGPSLYAHDVAIAHATSLFERSYGGNGEVKTFREGAADLPAALEAATGGGFFSEAVLVILKNGQFAAQDAETLTAWAGAAAPGSHVLVSSAALVPASPFVKKLRARATVCFFAEPKGKDFRKQAAALAKRRGLMLDPDAAALLFDAFEGNLAALDSELERLALYVAPRRTVKLDDVTAGSSARALANRFELIEKVAGGKRGEALELLERILREGEQPHALLSMLTTEVRKLLKAAELFESGCSADEVLENLSVRFYRRSFLARVGAARERWRPDGVLRLLVEADREVKTSARPPEVVLEGVVCALCEQHR